MNDVERFKICIRCLEEQRYACGLDVTCFDWKDAFTKDIELMKKDIDDSKKWQNYWLEWPGFREMGDMLCYGCPYELEHIVLRNSL